MHFAKDFIYIKNQIKHKEILALLSYLLDSFIDTIIDELKTIKYS